ncbi:uncharacterized protein LOC128559850 [Mercenaria mercenaria]|uniref:uncharacterized protein LOC128559850 n=1 Tax=Mercenaria mercenaria TaxID=6596 RepID=UPI00234F15BE|nr:uncharacterized protein LOC128559850 [Mercenaria mercenaria]
MFTAGTSLQVILLISCCQFCSTLFYTNSRENDYPRIGKRVELYEVLKRENSFPKYSETYSQGVQHIKKLSDFANEENSLDIRANEHSIFGELGQDRNHRPILIAVQQKSPNNNRHNMETDEADDFLELFQRIDPELDDIS